ncbi:cobalt ECF transporter T component CbiQ [bacterium]|nr:cobalt ECF transporter T component CbiQ [bacterium]
MIDSSFSNGTSFLHRLDPRVKIISILIYSIFVAVERSCLPLFYASLLPLLFLFICRLNFRDLGKRIVVVNGFILLLWFFLPFSYPGEKLFSMGFLSASREGIHYCLLITWKCNLILLTTLLLLATSSILNLVHALHHLKLPEKLVQLFYFSYRYIPVIHTEYMTLGQAMKVRAFKAGNNIHTYRSIGYLVGMLLLRAYERSQAIYHAMTVRGFQGTFWTFHHFHWKKADCLASILLLFYFCGFAYFKWNLLLN